MNSPSTLKKEGKKHLGWLTSVSLEANAPRSPTEFNTPTATRTTQPRATSSAATANRRSHIVCVLSVLEPRNRDGRRHLLGPLLAPLPDEPRRTLAQVAPISVETGPTVGTRSLGALVDVQLASRTRPPRRTLAGVRVDAVDALGADVAGHRHVRRGALVDLGLAALAGEPGTTEAHVAAGGGVGQPGRDTRAVVFAGRTAEGGEGRLARRVLVAGAVFAYLPVVTRLALASGGVACPVLDADAAVEALVGELRLGTKGTFPKEK